MAYAMNNQQPMAVPGMTTAQGNRNVKNLPIEADGREWSNGFFDCFADAGTCLIAWCFPCVIYSKNLKRLEHLNQKGYPDPENGGGVITGDCVTHGCLTFCGCGFVMQMGTRRNVRSRYNIKGGSGSDCCTAFCCTPCELTQESREIELEEQSFQQQQQQNYGKA